jgi:hypothetical protein
MRIWITVVAGAVLLGMQAVSATRVAAKEPAQPAFGKELVPDQAAQKDPKAIDLDDELEGEEDKPSKKKAFRPPPRAGRAQRLHIQLDGDEDGGGSGDGGEF